jgi:hypothetical protein
MEQVRHESGRRIDLLGHLALWLTILGTIIFFYVRNPHTFGMTRLLLAVLAVDAFRNILENIYFGLYFGSVYEVLRRNSQPCWAIRCCRSCRSS